MTANKPGDPTTLNRLYGRSQGKPLRAGQQALIDGLLPQIAVPAEGAVSAARLFGGDRPLHFEIGFGGGEHLAYRADLLPDHGFIGAEPFLNGMGKMLVHLDDAKLANVRLFAGDARRLVAALEDASLARVFLLFPDPWPKKRHWKRRYVQDETLAELARVLEPGGMLRIASDIPHYIEWTAEHAARRSEFAAVHPDGGWRERPEDWPPTRYEQKAIRAGRPPVYLEFRRSGSGSAS
jgi:tRNA (guanine-N7-)-methyltransferase